MARSAFGLWTTHSSNLLCLPALQKWQLLLSAASHPHRGRRARHAGAEVPGAASLGLGTTDTTHDSSHTAS